MNYLKPSTGEHQQPEFTSCHQPAVSPQKQGPTGAETFAAASELPGAELGRDFRRIEIQPIK